MIIILEREANKIPGPTSLFITFNYNAEVVNSIKNLTTVRNYDVKTKEWEIPITDLAKLLDNLCYFDTDIELLVLKDKRIKKDLEFKLNKHKTKPYPYQEAGILYGLNHDKFLLLDLPGLGKSLQSILLAEELKERKGIEHCLVICGINTLKANWVKEIHQHSKLSCRILGERLKRNGTKRTGSIAERLEDLKKPIKEFFVILNIETLRDDKILKELNNTKHNKFDMIIVDEGHKFKNPQAAQTKNFLKLKVGKYRVSMTGTLLLNSPVDAYTLLKFIGVENSTFTNFKFYYSVYSGPFNNILLGYRNIPVLKSLLDSCSIRRTKDILDLPPKNIINEFLDMDDTQKLFYENITKGIVEQIDKVELNSANLLAMTARLRQATVCPTILTTENIPSAKIDRACDLVDQIIDNGEKVVIFDTFKEPLNVLAERLKLYQPLVCTGDIKDNIISLNIDAFQTDPNYKVMLCTTAKMGTGITLTAASYAIFIGTPWTYAEFELCMDRVHRIGSKKPIFIYCLWCNDTIDIHVKEIVENKEMISDYIVDNKITASLSTKLKDIILDLKK